VLATYGVLTSLRQNPMPAPTSTPLTIVATAPEDTPEPATPAAQAGTLVVATVAASPTVTPPVPTRTPLPLPPGPTPTLPPGPTRAPTRPQLVEPAWGGGPFRNPIEFRWRGSLDPGQAYQVTLYNIGLGYIMARSPFLQTTSWRTDLPDKTWASGEYLWKVSVMSGGRELIASPDRTFWFSPIGKPQSP